MTCWCAGTEDLKLIAEKRALPDTALNWWRSTEEGAVALAALMDVGGATDEPRAGQWQMENATRHVRLTRAQYLDTGVVRQMWLFGQSR